MKSTLYLDIFDTKSGHYTVRSGYVIDVEQRRNQIATQISEQSTTGLKNSMESEDYMENKTLSLTSFD